METYFQIGNLYLAVHTSQKLDWAEKLEPFSITLIGNEVKIHNLQVVFVKKFSPIYGKLLYQDSQKLIMDVNGCENDIYLIPGIGEPFALTEHIDAGHLKISIDERFFSHIKWNRTLFGFFALEHLSLMCQQFLLHASFVIYNDTAIVFSAPSGTGKSTQADLWARYEGAEIINGDRVLLMNHNGQWYACGFPICGSSPYCLNKKAPIKAIIYLGKSPENMIKRLDAAEAFRKLYSQSIVNRWNASDCLKISELLNSVCEKIPIYMYNCTKEKSAVKYLKKTLNLNDSRSNL